MTCPKCNSTIPDTTIVCPVCGDKCAVNNQQARVDRLKAQSKEILHNSLHSKLFLAMTILMTVASAFKFVSCFTVTATNGNVNFNFDITVIFTVLTAVFSWMAYKSTDVNLAPQHLNRISIYDAAEWIMMVVAVSACGILSITCFALIGVGDEIISKSMTEIKNIIEFEYGDIEELEEITEMLSVSGGALFGIMAVIFLIVAAILLWVCIIHLRRRRFFKNASNDLSTGEYKITKAPPYTGALVYSILTLIGSIPSSADAVALISTMGNISVYTYVIVSTIWLSNLHKDLTANNNIIREETNLLNNLIAASQNIMATEPAQVYRPETNGNDTINQ
ncbi:MAG: zinc ribbon domain-containing protein [Clostridia bacterium]|nr:zinc ribbon domain-containing protein [Clostridia bacterium]